MRSPLPILLPLLLPCGAAWHYAPAYRKARSPPLTARAAALPRTSTVAPLSLSASSAARYQHPDRLHSATEKASGFLAVALRPLRRLFAAVRRLIENALQYLRDAQALASDVPVLPRSVVAIDGALSLSNLFVAAGTVTREVPPANEVLAFFNYGLSPFYAELPTEAAPKAAALPSGADSAVRCLRHRHARAPSEYQVAADEARLSLLRELYDEALARDRLQRGAGRWTPPWANSD